MLTLYLANIPMFNSNRTSSQCQIIPTALVSLFLAFTSSLLGESLLADEIQTLASERGFHRIPLAARTREGNMLELYQESHALLIGVSAYEHWGSLPSIPSELDAVAEVLEDSGFNVQRLQNPTSKEIKSGITEFINEYGFNEESRLLIYYSGHGHTLGDKGFILPADIPLPENRKEFLRHAVSMDQVMAWARDMFAKHVLFIFDSCFSGSIFKSKNLPTNNERYIRDVTNKPARQFITAGSANEEVPARSTFTPSLVDAIRGEGDLNDDGYVTANELGVHLSQYVPRYTKQTPQFGSIRDYGLGRGDFVFLVNNGEMHIEVSTSDEIASQAEIDKAYWDAVSDDDTVISYQSYLKRFPDGIFSDIASYRMNKSSGAEPMTHESRPSGEEIVGVENTTNEDRIENLIDEVETHIKHLRLTLPSNNNANDSLSALTKLDPDSTFVSQKRELIRDIYASWIDREVEQNNIEKAARYLNLIKLIPDSHAFYDAQKEKVDIARTVLNAGPLPVNNSAEVHSTDELEHTPNEGTEAFTLYKSCLKNDSEACVEIGKMYSEGDVLPQSSTLSLKYFTLSCNNGSGIGCWYLGSQYNAEKAITKDVSKIRGIFLRSCKLAHFEGCREMSRYYRDADDRKKLPIENAINTFNASCSEGNGDGCSHLAFMYFNGLGVKINYRRSATLYTNGCDLNSRSSCIGIANLYREGAGVFKSEAKARSLLAKAEKLEK